MRKGPTVIEISGIKGIILASFVVVCLVAGFVLFPAKAAEYTWNYVMTAHFGFPEINFIQGLLLWAFIALSVYIINSRTYAIEIRHPRELNNEEMHVLMDRIRMQKQAQRMNTMVIKAEDLKNFIKEEAKRQREQEDEQDTSSNNVNEKHS